MKEVEEEQERKRLEGIKHNSELFGYLKINSIVRKFINRKGYQNWRNNGELDKADFSAARQPSEKGDFHRSASVENCENDGEFRGQSRLLISSKGLILNSSQIMRQSSTSSTAN